MAKEISLKIVEFRAYSTGMNQYGPLDWLYVIVGICAALLAFRAIAGAGKRLSR